MSPNKTPHNVSMAVVKWQENRHEKVNTYDFRTHDGRYAFQRFTSWALSRGYSFTVQPGTITVNADTQHKS
jgi:hypothetical protein